MEKDTENENKNIKNIAHVQVTEGCDKFQCFEPLCKSCKDFVSNSAKEQEEKISFITETIETHVCDGISPFITDETLFLKIQNFDSTIKKYLNENNNEDISDSDMEIMKNVLCDANSFPFILTTLHQSNIPYNFKNRLLKDDDLYNLTELTLKQNHILQRIKNSFKAMTRNFLKKPSLTRSNVRGFVLLFCFLDFLDLACVEEIIKRVMNFSHDAEVYFWTTLEELPNFVFKFIGQLTGKFRLISPGAKILTILQRDALNIIAPFCKRVFAIRMENQEMFIIKELEKLVPVLKIVEAFENDANDFETDGIFFTREQKFDVFNTMIESKRERKSIEKNEINDIPQDPCDEPYPVNKIMVKRTDLANTAIRELESIDPSNFLLYFEVTFEGEDGVDRGGLTREFFYKLAEEIFSPKYGMFDIIDDKFYWFSVNSDTGLSYYKLLGTIVALAVVNFVPIPISFPLLLYKKLLGKKIILDDLEEFGSSYVSNIKQTLEMRDKGENIEDLCLNFTAGYKKYETVKVAPIIEGGEDIPVTNDNLDIYISQYIQWIAVDSVDNVFNAFADGFFRVIDRRRLSFFTPQDISQLVSGVPKFDWKALKDACTYTEYKSNSKVIKNFWDAFFNDFNEEDRKHFLMFATGCGFAPIGGLGKVKITIFKCSDPNALPTAHTCDRSLMLPCYSTKKIMIDKIKLAIYNTETFGFK